jgi:hypothetical protein
MADSIELSSLSHINAIVDGYKSAVAHFTGVYGGVLNMEIPDDGETRACLITIGGVIFEFFAPNDRNAERGQGRLLGRYGNHYIGAEYRVPNVAMAREKCQELGLRIINDRGEFFYTYPGNCHGISWELWDHDWHDVLSPDNAERREDWRVIPTNTYWRDEHPMGLTGLVRLSSAVEDLGRAVDRFAEVIGAEMVYQVDRPSAGATAAGLRVGDTILELLAPTGLGAVRAYLDRYGERIRSTVFGVLDLGRAESYLLDRGVPLVEGDAPGTRAIPPAHNHGLLFELTEEPATHP